MNPTCDSVPSAWFPSAIEDQEQYAINLSFFSRWTPFPWRRPSPCNLVGLYGAYSPTSIRQIIGWAQCSFPRWIFQTDSIEFRSTLMMFQSWEWWFQPSPASPSLSGSPLSCPWDGCNHRHCLLLLRKPWPTLQTKHSWLQLQQDPTDLMWCPNLRARFLRSLPALSPCYPQCPCPPSPCHEDALDRKSSPGMSMWMILSVWSKETGNIGAMSSESCCTLLTKSFVHRTCRITHTVKSLHQSKRCERETLRGQLARSFWAGSSTLLA
jgi:hypothetical protein